MYALGMEIVSSKMGTVTIRETVCTGMSNHESEPVEKVLHSTMYPSGLESESESESVGGNKPLLFKKHLVQQ